MKNNKDIKLVKLYNRLSYYFCYCETNEIEVKQSTTIKELQQQLDSFYDKNNSDIKNKKF